MFHNSLNLMKGRFLPGILLCLFLQLASFPSYADSSELDALFLELKNAEGQAEAYETEGKIWMVWLKSGDLKYHPYLKERSLLPNLS